MQLEFSEGHLTTMFVMLSEMYHLQRLQQFLSGQSQIVCKTLNYFPVFCPESRNLLFCTIHF